MDSIDDNTAGYKSSHSQANNSSTASPDSHPKPAEKNSYFVLPYHAQSSSQGDFSFAEPISPGARTQPPRLRSGARRNEGALGKNTSKYEPSKNQGLTSEVFLQVNSVTGEVEVYKHGKNGTIHRQIDRATARLDKWELMDCMQTILKGQRACNCLRTRIASQVSVVHSKTSCRYLGLMICGSVWHCPVCAQRITEYRRNELHHVTQCHLDLYGRGTLVMVTNTIPHGRHDDMDKLLTRFRKAEATYRDYTAMRKLRARIGWIGSVRGLEWTYGFDNGSHPHTHNLWFIPKPVDHKTLQELLSVHWRKACKKVGLREPDPHAGLMVTDGRVYPAKWGIDHELTKSHTKKGVKGMTPWDLLRWYMREPNPQAAALFNEYAKVFYRKQQLRYSDGLKDLYAIEEIKDEQIAQGTEDDGVLICKLTPRQWYHVCKHKARGIVLHLAEKGGAEAVMPYVASLENGKPVPDRPLAMTYREPPKVEIKPAQSGELVRVECVKCKELWWSRQPGVHVCPRCNSHWFSRVLYQPPTSGA